MYEFTVIWNEDGDEDPSTYSFSTIEEARAFQLAVGEADFHGRDSIRIEIKENLDYEAEPDVEPGPHVEFKVIGMARAETISPWLQLLFAVFIGGWSMFWWHLFRGPEIMIEYALVGLIATLMSYITVLLFSWQKTRQKNV